ncbi:hypothetical protein [Variovorax fucosicus]|uniref:hypothetical protein n=1 Tax=Variovorax fucosicus TaxID=3053517 RepID=UPI002576A329|nr:hypothetical protein [Variovorax sp. J22G47]MDM0056827.1 hypothetical protein [Variovorax sp. J22G47]
MQILDRHLVKAVVDLAVFLEFSSEDLLDADASIEAMEQLASELGRMSEENKRDFFEITLGLAPDYGEKKGFVSDLAQSLGLQG